MVQLWYPAKKIKLASTTAYLANPELLSAMKKEQYLDLRSDVMEGWGTVQTHSKLDAPTVTKPRQLPVLIFSHGAGMSRSSYTSIIEDLASHGYIIAAIDHPYLGLSVMSDGRVQSFSTDTRGPEAVVARVESMAQDASFVLDALLDMKGVSQRFAGHIDARRVGVFGHSLGGAAALEVCRSSTRFKACADLDGSVWGKVESEGINRPYLVMLNVPGAAHRPPPAMRKQRDDEWAAIISRKKTTAFVVKIEGTYHFSFSDIPFIVPESLLKENGADILPQRGFEIITRVLGAFFFHYLNGKNRPTFKTVTNAFHEVTVQTYN